MQLAKNWPQLNSLLETVSGLWLSNVWESTNWHSLETCQTPTANVNDYVQCWRPRIGLFTLLMSLQHLCLLTDIRILLHTLFV